MRNLLNLTDGREVDVLGREYHGGITRVHTSILDMLGDGILDDLTLIGYGIEFDFLRLCHELRYNHWELLRHLSSHTQETMQLLVVVADVHRCT